MIHNSPVPSYLKRGDSEVPYASRKKERLALKKREGGDKPRPDKSI
jgi:hypothetical protein